MDALMIFDSNNYLVYLKYNGIFLDELSDIVREYNLTASGSQRKIKKMLMTDSNELQNCIVLIFAPYIASIRVLQSECPPINIFPEQDSIQIAHTQYLDYIFLYLLDGKESEGIYQIEQRLSMFVSISKMLFGASICDIKIGGEQTCLLDALFDRWRIVENGPIFLVEAIERIILSSTIRTEFTNLLFQCLHKFRNNINLLSEEMPSHCMLFVENKLVSRVSSPDAAKISRIDLVLLTLFVDTFHSSKSDNSSRDDNLVQEKSSDEYFGDDESLENENFDRKKSHSIDRKQSLSSNYQGNSMPLKNQKPFHHYVIFLRSSVDSQCLVPYYLRLINIQDSMSVLILSQLPTTLVTFHIHKLWHILNLLQYRPKELRFSHDLDEFDTSLNRLRKIMGELKKKSDIIRKLCNKLDQLYKSNVRKYILGAESEEITAKLDSLCSSVCSLLRFVYSRKIYFHHISCIEKLENEIELISRMMNVKQACSQVAMDYGEYLMVKAQRNISLESFLDIAPDLVAFIYLDRNSNEFIMATLDDYQDALGDSELLNSNIANNVLPRAVQNAYHQLSNGKTSSSWSENGLFYNYLMWLEDDEGKPIELYKNRRETFSYANMMCVDFIEQIHKALSLNHKMSAIQKGKKTLACYELFHIVKFNLKNDHDRLMEAKNLAFRLKKITSNVYDHFSTSK